MDNVFDGLDSVIDNYSEGLTNFNQYLYFEPWDIDHPTPEVLAKAAEDGVSLYNDDVTKIAGGFPRQFQTGAILSKATVVCQLAASRVGKSVSSEVIIGASISRQPPYSMRYKAGVDTGIRREVSQLNIRRFGRFSVLTGKVIDHNELATPDKSWDCGTIIGVGLFPEELYCPDGGQIWIGTVAKSIDTHWWRRLAGRGEARFLPEEFMDLSKGNHGSNRQKLEIHCPRDISIFIKSYDADSDTTFESDECHILVYDEEPPKPKQYISGNGHSKFQRWSFTALKGVTYTKSLFFGCVNKADSDRGKRLGTGVLDKDSFEMYQATAYDSPYIEESKKDATRKSQPIYSRASITWGRYSENTGNPFFARSKIQMWQRSFLHDYRKVTLKPEMAYDGMYGKRAMGTKGLLQIKIIQEKAKEDDMRNVWRIYEPPIENEGYILIVDSAEGATDPEQSQDYNFGLMCRLPRQGDPVGQLDHLVIVATIRSTLPTIAFAHYTSLALRLYNNAVLAAERGHGKDNEAYGVTLDEYPFWYYRESQNDKTKKFRLKKGFDTHVGTRNTMLSQVRTWLDDFEENEDPYIRDSWLYDELAGAVVKESRGGKKRCDHTKDGFLDGVVCLAIGTFIFNESPDVIVCNDVKVEEVNKRPSLIQRMTKQNAKQEHIHMGAISKGGRI
jgi:hypothetical protein